MSYWGIWGKNVLQRYTSKCPGPGGGNSKGSSRVNQGLVRDGVPEIGNGGSITEESLFHVQHQLVTGGNKSDSIPAPEGFSIVRRLDGLLSC